MYISSFAASRNCFQFAALKTLRRVKNITSEFVEIAGDLKGFSHA
jgi:hypothetical protein